MCMIDSADGFDWESLNSTIRCARKPHKCSECDRTISPGERYHYEFAKSEGSTYQYATCIHCWEGPCAWLRRECHGFLWQGVNEDLREHLDYAVHEMSNPLTVAKWCVAQGRNWKRKDGTLMPIPTLPAHREGVLFDFEPADSPNAEEPTDES